MSNYILNIKIKELRKCARCGLSFKKSKGYERDGKFFCEKDNPFKCCYPGCEKDTSNINCYRYWDFWCCSAEHLSICYS